MKMTDLKTKLDLWVKENSGLEDRDYLGMSQIGRCPRMLYDQFLSGKLATATHKDHSYCYLGYLFEIDLIDRLAEIDPTQLGPSEEYTDLEGKFRGHTDGTWAECLLEIKSTTSLKLPRFNRVPHAVYWQVQTYMHYGDFDRAIVIYIARDTGEIVQINIKRNRKIGELARIKASEILEAIDFGKSPMCECNRCGLRSR